MTTANVRALSPAIVKAIVANEKAFSSAYSKRDAIYGKLQEEGVLPSYFTASENRQVVREIFSAQWGPTVLSALTDKTVKPTDAISVTVDKSTVTHSKQGWQKLIAQRRDRFKGGYERFLKERGFEEIDDKLVQITAPTETTGNGRAGKVARSLGERVVDQVGKWRRQLQELEAPTSRELELITLFSKVIDKAREGNPEADRLYRKKYSGE